MCVGRIVLLALCAVLALGAPFASAASPAGEACAATTPSAGGMPCGCDMPAAVSICALACGFVFSLSPLAVGLPGSGIEPATEAAATGPPGRFASRAGAPALHPPR